MKEIEKTKQQKIMELEESLDLIFPRSYRQFLLEQGSAVIDGYNILGIPTKEVEVSVSKATEILRKRRQDLPKTLIPICFDQDRALCLDLTSRPKEDAPLLNVSFNKEKPSLSVRGNTFKRWIETHQGMERRFKIAYQRVTAKRKETEEWKDRKFGAKKRQLLPRPKDWHPIVSRVEDYIVGLAALRYNPRFNCLEVDEFYSRDHPDYEPGGAIRNLANIIFTMARDFSGSLNIVFTKKRRDGKASFFRPFRRIPQGLVNLAEEYRITFKEAEQGKISHQEGVELFFAILEFPLKTQEIVKKLEEADYLTREMIAEIIATGTIWSREEVVWLLENASRPEAVILGTDLPENRLLHSDSLNYGRSVLLTKRFQRVVLAEITNGFSSEEREMPECLLEPRDRFWILKSAKGFHLPWMMNKEEKVWVGPQEQILIFSRPRIISGIEENHNWIRENITLLETKKDRIKIKLSCLILNYEFISRDFEQNVEKVKEIAREAAQKGIYVLFPYDRCDQLDLEVEEKMRRARRMRQFPVRTAQLALRIIGIPKTRWQTNEKFGHVARNAYDYGRLVANKVNITRYRSDFIITSAAVERMALQYPKRKTRPIIEMCGKESQEILKALRSENGITSSFVMPDEMSQFFKRLNKKTREFLKDVQGGITVIGIPYEKVEVSRKKPQLPTVRAELPASFVAEIDKQVEEKIQDKVYVSRDIYLKSVHQEIRKVLKNGLPLAISYIYPQVFVEAIRDYIHQPLTTVYREETKYRQELKYRTEKVKKSIFGQIVSIIKKESLFKKVQTSYYEPVPYKEMVPYKQPLISSSFLRIVYNDGSEGGLFPLFSLSEDIGKQKKLYELPAQLVSLRHMLADYATEVSIIRNVEIQRKEDSAEQEEFAFRKVYFFIETFLKLIRGEISIEEAGETALIFKVLWEGLNLEKEVPKQGLKLHLFQSTGLEPAIAGAYRAVVELLQKYRGKLVVVPRIYKPNGNLKKEFEKLPMFDMAGKRKIVSGMYPSAQEWY